jgi:hypothetical protein
VPVIQEAVQAENIAHPMGLYVASYVPDDRRELKPLFSSAENRVRVADSRPAL